MKYLFLATIAVAAGVAAQAQETKPDARQDTQSTYTSESPPEPAVDLKKIVCKYQQRTGTRFKKKACHTVEQWIAISEAAKEGLADIQRQPRGMPDGSD